MRKVCDLLPGWYLLIDANANAWFVDVYGNKLHTFDMARHPKGREMYREVKRQLDIADLEWVNPGMYPPWIGLDKARIGLEYALGMVNKWSPDLYDTGVDKNHVRANH